MITTTISGDKELLLAFSRVETIMQDHRTVFEKLEDPVLLAIRKRIDAQGYQPLTPEYAKQKVKRFGGKPILRATDQLYGSFSKGGQGNVSRIQPLSAEFGSSVPYGVFHQEGTGRLPKRPIVEITNDDEGRFTKVFVNSLNEKIKAIGFQV